MRKTLLSCFLVMFFLAGAQTNETWNWQDYCVGLDTPGDGYDTEAAMPEVQYINGQYIMYYNAKYNNIDAIKYATSNDGKSWVTQDTIFLGSPQSTDREFFMGGARVIQLSNGSYRMFYRCAPAWGENELPKYHLRSAISTDGINFTKEGIRIEINDYLTNGYFTRAAHSAFYYDSNDILRAIITGADTTMDINSADRLYKAWSNDEGETWNDFTPLYDDGHDPVVIFDTETNSYRMYFAVLQHFYTTNSIDGINWPNQYDTLHLIKDNDTLWVQNDGHRIGDLGAVELTSGENLLYSNFKPDTVVPWSNIVYYTKDVLTNNTATNEIKIEFYPNPFQNEPLSIQSNTPVEQIRIYDQLGKLVYIDNNFNDKYIVPSGKLPTGVLFIQLKTSSTLKSYRIIHLN